MMTPLALLSNSLFFTLLTTTFTLVHGLQYDAREADYNLNTNKAAQHPLDYSGEKGGDYNPSPKNWRVPFYTLFLDRFVNGNPENDNANGTNYETDMMSTQLRFGGDLEGLVDSLDYLEGMGIKGIYLAGSPFINQPWGADSYSVCERRRLKKHFGVPRINQFPISADRLDPARQTFWRPQDMAACDSRNSPPKHVGTDGQHHGHVRKSRCIALTLVG